MSALLVLQPSESGIWQDSEYDESQASWYSSLMGENS